MGLRGRHQILLVPEEVVEPAGQIEALFKRGVQFCLPGLGDHPAPVRHADDERLGPLLAGLGQGHVGQAHIGLAARQAQLADGVFRAPVANPLGDFGGKLVGRVAQEQKIRRFDHWQGPHVSGCSDDSIRELHAEFAGILAMWRRFFASG